MIRYDTTCVVIPMKNPAESKQRLSPALNDRQRSELAVSMLINTLAFFRREFPALTVLVVTPSAHIAALTRGHGHQVLLESRSRGLNKAIEHATCWSLQHGFRRQLVIPADIAELSRQEIRCVLDSLPHTNGVTLVPSKDGGTNALLSSPPDAIAFRFGHNSARAHELQAQKNGLLCQQLALEKLSNDIDQPQDLLPAVTAILPFSYPQGVLSYV